MSLTEQNISVMNFHYIRHTLDRFLADVCDARGLGRKVRDMGLQIVAFTPEQCVYPINISAREPQLRDRSLRYFLTAMEHAVECGAPALLVTAGGGYRDEPASDAMDRCVESMGLLCGSRPVDGNAAGFVRKHRPVGQGVASADGHAVQPCPACGL